MSRDKELAALIEEVSAPDYELPADAQIRVGTPEARAATLAMLLEAADSPEEREMIRGASSGRPTLGQTGANGESPMWKVRAEADLDADARAQAEREGRNLSDIIRDGVRLYLTTHAAA
jgi:hypothetical protein